ncbi:O-methyltransferase [Lacinutrix chionoecetis]
MSSFRKINYSLRPAKAVERKMMSFALKKLSNFDSFSSYQYVGFGSTFFNDFILFHKDLGINKMISIESSTNKMRFNFNKPFHCIKMEFGDSHTILPSLDWTMKNIVWLDYDKTLRRNYLSDISTFITSAVSGSFFMITINCEPSAYGETNQERKNELSEKIGQDNLHFGNRPIDFSTNNLSTSLYQIISDYIKSELMNRNGGLTLDNKLKFKQLFHFNYADGVKMLTIGGMLVNPEHEKIFNIVNFNEHSFIKDNQESFNINIPSLTLKEIRFLNAQLPSAIDEEGNLLIESLPDISNPNLPISDIKKYSKIYSFFPLYTEAFSI